MSDLTDERTRLWPEPWASQAWVQARSIEHQMRVAAGAAPLDARRQAAVDAIEELLELTRQAVRQRGRRRRRGPVDRWRGTSVELAYHSLHAARVFLVDLLSPQEIDALIPGVTARAETGLHPDDPRRLDLDGLAEAPLGRKRALVKRAMQVGYDASDQSHTRVRGFRNAVILAGVLIALFTGAFVFVVAQFPTTMDLCFRPAVTTQQATSEGTVRKACPSGEDELAVAGGAGRRSQPADVIIVAGLGLLGGALAAAFAIRKIRGTSTPYDVPIALAWLKVPFGALSALTGILLLGGGFVPGLSELDSQRQILAYALVFGYAQEIATRFIDARAQSLLQGVPSKDPQAKPPPRTRAQPRPPQPPDDPPEQAGAAEPVEVELYDGESLDDAVVVQEEDDDPESLAGDDAQDGDEDEPDREPEGGADGLPRPIPGPAT